MGYAYIDANVTCEGCRKESLVYSDDTLHCRRVSYLSAKEAVVEPRVKLQSSLHEGNRFWKPLTTPDML